MKTIVKRLCDHYFESCEYFPKSRIVALCLQGSQNYELDTPTSDVDTKLIVAPSFKDLAMNKQPISTTHVRANEEHIDFKDVRLYLQTFRKQNLNFLEILFTKYYLTNPVYYKEWQRLIDAREEIAHMNPTRAVKSMYGLAQTKYKGMTHNSPAKAANFEKYNYDPKELSHLLRIHDFINRYIQGDSYENCMIPTGEVRENILAAKRGEFTRAEAELKAEAAMSGIFSMTDDFIAKNLNLEENQETVALLEDVQYNIMKIAMEEELFNGNAMFFKYW